MPSYNGLMLEGNAEAAIIDVLLDHQRLLFTREQLIANTNGDLYQKTLSDNKFVKDFLSHGFSSVVDIHIVLDNPKFISKLKKKSNQVGNIYYYVTREEIEAVQLYADPIWPAQYQKYLAHHAGREAKPSAFFKTELQEKRIKKYDFVYDLWCDHPDKLCQALQKVKTEMSRKNSLPTRSNYHYLADLIK